MKKVLSVLLAVAMLCALAVPAFAAEIKYENGTVTGNNATVIIRTTETKLVDENGDPVDPSDPGYDPDDPGITEVDARSYTVMIPADQDIPWELPSYRMVYSVESHLGYGEAVNVSVTGSGVMTYQASAEDSFTLPYTLGGNTAYAATSPVVYPAANVEFTVDIAADDWNSAIIGVYQDQLTFTAEIV